MLKPWSVPYCFTIVLYQAVIELFKSVTSVITYVQLENILLPYEIYSVLSSDET